MSITIYDLAKKAGVSIATISRATSPKTRSKLSPKTLEKIDALIAKYNYAPSLTASRLAGKAFKSIGFLLPHFEGIFFSDYYASILSGISDAVLNSGHKFKLVLLKPSQRSMWDKYDFQSAEDVDALLVTHWPNFFTDRAALDKLKVPCVVVNDPYDCANVSFVAGDNITGGKRVGEYLLGKGCKKFLLIGGTQWSGDSQDRLNGFRAACRNKPVKIDHYYGDYLGQRAEKITEEYFSTGNNCDAIFCLNDHMAVGALTALKHLKIRCPEDVLVVGYDDDSVARHASVPLTTVRVPVYQMAKDAARRLIRYLDGDKKALGEKVTYYPVELIKRKSA